MTNGVRLEGHVMVPNLGYKKDAFLELSLISNFLFDITLPIPPLLCLPLVVPTSKLVINPTWVLPRCRRPMVRLLGQIASFGKELNSCKSTKRLKGKCCPGQINNQCPDAFLLVPGPFPIYPFPFLPTAATPSDYPHPYYFRDLSRSPATLSR